MNRKEMGYAVAGMLGAVAGAGCASPQSSEAFPSTGQTFAPDNACQPAIRITQLNLKINYASSFAKDSTTRVTTSNNTVCGVLGGHDAGNFVVLYPKEVGECTIVFEDDVTKARIQFKVSCLS